MDLTTAIDNIFDAIMQHPDFDEASTFERTTIMQALATRCTQYANDELNF